MSRDRRKPHVRRADEEAEAIAAATESEGEPDGRTAAPGFPDILRNQVLGLAYAGACIPIRPSKSLLTRVMPACCIDMLAAGLFITHVSDR